ncbi:MAG: hypothetical protein MI725_14300, partial [Pirellulales bacterium]|nr:hypothetical protein [Pirellulales bacterium]
TSLSTGYNGLTYRFAQAGNAATARWDFSLPFAGNAEVFVIYRSGTNRTNVTNYQIDTGNGVENASINQKINNLTWVSLGNFDFTAGSHHVLVDAQTSTGGSVVIADAVRVFLTAPTADFDQDTDVDGFDFLAWQLGAGTTGGATLAQGDGNGDGNVDGADLALWEAQFGTSALVASSQAPPAAKALTVTVEATVAVTSTVAPVAVASTMSPTNDARTLADVAQLVTFSKATLRSSPETMVEWTDNGQEFRREPGRIGNANIPTATGERVGQVPEQRPERATRDHQAKQEAFSEIGDLLRFNAHWFQQ